VTIGDRVILIRPTRLYRPGMSKDELYEATRGVWRVSLERAHQARYALAVIDRTVVEAYEIDGWQRAGTDRYRYRPHSAVSRPGRWEFVGRLAGPAGRRYVGADVSAFLAQGNQNPIRYINC
jgi:uncharacterized protein